eukprot:gene9287-biopygen5773
MLPESLGADIESSWSTQKWDHVSWIPHLPVESCSSALGDYRPSAQSGAAPIPIEAVIETRKASMAAQHYILCYVTKEPTQARRLFDLISRGLQRLRVELVSAGLDPRREITLDIMRRVLSRMVTRAEQGLRTWEIVGYSVLLREIGSAGVIWHVYSLPERRRMVPNPELVQFLLDEPECISTHTERCAPLYLNSVIHLAEAVQKRVAQARSSVREGSTGVDEEAATEDGGSNDPEP